MGMLDWFRGILRGEDNSATASSAASQPGGDDQCPLGKWIHDVGVETPAGFSRSTS